MSSRKNSADIKDISEGRSEMSETTTGFVAQEVEQAANSLGFNFSGIDKPKNGNDYYGLRYGEFVVPVVRAIQEQQTMIEQLRTENAALKERLARIEEKLNTK